LKCKACNKTFGNKNTLESHLNSTKHKETAKKAQTDEAKPSGIILDEKAQQIKVAKEDHITTIVDQSACLFCNKKNGDIDANLMHMRVEHSFFVSEIKYVTDLKGLLKYLGEKIHKGCLCIHCENRHAKDFKTGEAVQNHMMSKGHCFMKDDDYTEYIKYYDFSSTLNDYQTKIGGKIDNSEALKKDETYLEIVSGDEDEEWESDEEGDDEEESAEEKPKKSQQLTDESKQMEKEEEKKQQRIHRIKVKKAVVLDSGEVKLPSGKIIGHRGYKSYYKQYFRGDAQRSRMRDLIPSLSNELALLNPHNQLMIVNQINALKQREKIDKINKKYLHKAHQDYVKLGMQSNETLQKHFKQQCPL